MHKITKNNTPQTENNYTPNCLWYLHHQHTLHAQNKPNRYNETKSYISAQAHTCPCGTNGLDLNPNCNLCQYRHYWMHKAGFPHTAWNDYAPTRKNPTCTSCPTQPKNFTPGCHECETRINTKTETQTHTYYLNSKNPLKGTTWNNPCTYCQAPDTLFTPGCHACRTRARLQKNLKATSAMQALTGICDHSDNCSINCVFCAFIQAGNTLIPNGEYSRLCHNHENLVLDEEKKEPEQAEIFKNPVRVEGSDAWKSSVLAEILTTPIQEFSSLDYGAIAIESGDGYTPNAFEGVPAEAKSKKPVKRIPTLIYNPAKYAPRFPSVPHLKRPGRATRRLRRRAIPPVPAPGYCKGCGCKSTLYTEGCPACQNRHFTKWSKKQPTLYADWFDYQELTTVKHQVCSSCGTPMHLYQDGCNACFERYGLLPQNTLIIYPTPDDVIAFTKLRWEKSEKRAFKKISHLPM